MSWGDFRGGSCPGGSCPGGIIQGQLSGGLKSGGNRTGGNFMGGNCPGGGEGGIVTEPNLTLVMESGVHSSLHPNCHDQITYAKCNLKIY